MCESEERELEERQAEQSAEDNAREDAFDEGSEPDAQRATPAVGRGPVGNAGLASGSDSTAAAFSTGFPMPDPHAANMLVRAVAARCPDCANGRPRYTKPAEDGVAWHPKSTPSFWDIGQQRCPLSDAEATALEACVRVVSLR